MGRAGLAAGARSPRRPRPHSTPRLLACTHVPLLCAHDAADPAGAPKLSATVYIEPNAPVNDSYHHGDGLFLTIELGRAAGPDGSGIGGFAVDSIVVSYHSAYYDQPQMAQAVDIYVGNVR